MTSQIHDLPNSAAGLSRGDGECQEATPMLNSLLNNYSPKWRKIAADIYRAASTNNCFSIYNTSLIAIPKQVLYLTMKWFRTTSFSSGSRQEVNST